MKNPITLLLAFLFIASNSFAQENINLNKFRQLKQELATPNVYRTASGAPGHQYYQQKADYDIQVTLDDKKQTITGKETITYHNNSPDELRYLWIQLDQNVRAKDSDTKKISHSSITDKINISILKSWHTNFDGGFKINTVTDNNNKNIKYIINKTMMRIDLDEPLASKSTYSFKIEWNYNINNRLEIGGRSGYEHFKEEDNYLYTIAQFFPRMCVYNDVEGWQNKQFLGRGEFTLPFGDYTVRITVPADHVVGSTGLLQNTKDILSKEQIQRLEDAQDAAQPIQIVNQKEAEKAEKNKSNDTKTWIFKAQNVRDFAFATSRKFIWDAKGVKFGDRTVLAMSYYPKEGNPLWEKYSTEAVVQTLKTYSRMTIDYPYPVAISVHSKSIGMEYPMICFNGGRPEKDGTYSEKTKYAMISVIIHEVGHNFFPMIINSDERQWTWMDEGLNTFVQYITEKDWDREYPSRRGPAYKIVDYMKGDKSNITPIMTNSESIFQFGNNAYGKPATALNILRETILGRELFDYAFKEYCRRWAFKHPTPADFFRTMEDASAVDLDWFWRSWFYTTDHVDLALGEVTWYKINIGNPKNSILYAKEEEDKNLEGVGSIRNKEDIKQSNIERDPTLKDFYNNTNPNAPTAYDTKKFNESWEKLSADEKALIKKDANYYEVKLKMIGGIPMPVILMLKYKDGTSEVRYIPAEIWKMGNILITKVLITNKEIEAITLDPYRETADTDVSNNAWPKVPNAPSRFKVFKKEQKGGYFGGGKPGLNPMQKAKIK